MDVLVTTGGRGAETGVTFLSGAPSSAETDQHFLIHLLLFIHTTIIIHSIVQQVSISTFFCIAPHMKFKDSRKNILSTNKGTPPPPKKNPNNNKITQNDSVNNTNKHSWGQCDFLCFTTLCLTWLISMVTIHPEKFPFSAVFQL